MFRAFSGTQRGLGAGNIAGRSGIPETGKRRNITTRPTSYRKGLIAEFVAQTALRLKGYRIIAGRYRSKLGEIDIIAARGKTLVFVEVKARATKDGAMESIARRQQERLARGAQDFLARHPRYAKYNIRFDAMLMAPWCWPVHISNAWNSDS